MKSERAAPQISVIVPVFNAESFLAETIESVVGQDFTDWELILVDDGSTDGGVSIAKRYVEKYAGKIIYAEHENHANKAAAATRNLGISKASGELVAFLDADDVWLPDYLAGQVAVMRENPEISVLCQATRYWYSWADAAEQEDVEIQVGAESERLYELPRLAEILYPLGDGAAPCPSAVVVKKSVLEAVGGFEESFVGKYQVFEDQAFLIKLYLRHRVFVSSNCRNLYRQRAGSVMDSTATEGLHDEARKFFLHWLEDYLRKERINEPSVHNRLQKALRASHYPKINRVIGGLKHRLHHLSGRFSNRS